MGKQDNQSNAVEKRIQVLTNEVSRLKEDFHNKDKRDSNYRRGTTKRIVDLEKQIERLKNEQIEK